MRLKEVAASSSAIKKDVLKGSGRGRQPTQEVLDGAMQDRNDEPTLITPHQYGERIVLQIGYETTRLEAEFMEKARRTDTSGFMELLEDHVLKRFDIWALATVPFAKSLDSVAVHQRYPELLDLAKQRTLRHLCKITCRMHPDWENEMLQRVEPRLEINLKLWVARVGLALLRADQGPFLVENGDTAKPDSSSEAPGTRNEATELPPTAQQNGRATPREATVVPILDRKGWSILDWASASNVDYHTASDYLQGNTKSNRSTG